MYKMAARAKVEKNCLTFTGQTSGGISVRPLAIRFPEHKLHFAHNIQTL
jgi:hypothetical protein